MGSGTGRVPGSGDMAENTEGAWVIALYIFSGDHDDHKRIGGFIGARLSCTTHHTLEIGSFKVPASTVGGPELSQLAL